MTRVHTRYSQIVAVVTGNVWQLVWSMEELHSSKTAVNEFKTFWYGRLKSTVLLVDAFKAYHSFDHIMKDVQRFRTVSVLNSSFYEHF